MVSERMQKVITKYCIERWMETIRADTKSLSHKQLRVHRWFVRWCSDPKCADEMIEIFRWQNEHP